MRERFESSRRSFHVLGLLTVLAMVLAPLAKASPDDPEKVVIKTIDPTRITNQERPWAFTMDPSTPSAGVWSFGYALGLGSGISADRPLPVNMATSDGSNTFQVTYGITGGVAPFVTATFADVGTSSASQNYELGALWQLTRPEAHFRMTFAGSGFHEGQTDDNGVRGVVAASLDNGPIRVAGNFRADKVFATGRDAVDLIATVGALWKLGSSVRLGAEYVGQDLEEMTSAEAEAGSRHTVGPTLAFDLDGGRYQVAVGSGFGLNAASPRVIGRLALAFNY